MTIYTFQGKRYKRVSNIIAPNCCSPCHIRGNICGMAPSCIDDRLSIDDPRRYYIYVLVVDKLNNNIKVI